MKAILLTIVLLSAQAVSAQDFEVNQNISKLFVDEDVTGTFVLFDVQRNKLIGHNQKRADQRFFPASSFKIANSLIGLHTDAVSNVDEVLPYGGKPQKNKAWENDMSLRDAIKITNVPIYQELARRIGLKKMQENLMQLGYGNMAAGNVIDRFWLDGPLEISAIEQVHFLSKLAQEQLYFRKEHQKIVAEIIEFEKTDDWTLYAKTGWQVATDPGTGWWVGWVKRGEEIYCFALNMDLSKNENAGKRIDISLASLRTLGIIN